MHGWGCLLRPEVAATATKGTPVATGAAADGAAALPIAVVPLLQWLADRGCALSHVAVRVVAVRHGEVGLLGWPIVGCTTTITSRWVSCAGSSGEEAGWLAQLGVLWRWAVAAARGCSAAAVPCCCGCGRSGNTWCLQRLGVRVGAGDGAEGAEGVLLLLLLAPGVRAWLKEQQAGVAAKGGTRLWKTRCGEELGKAED